MVNGSLLFKKTAKILELDDVLELEEEKPFEKEIKEAEKVIRELEESVKSSVILNHNYDREIEETKRKIETYEVKLKEFLEKDDEDYAKFCVRSIKRHSVEVDDLQAGKKQAYERHQILAEDLDLAKGKLHKLKRKRLSAKIGSEEKLENRSIEETLIRAAEEAEVEQKLQEYKRKYDDNAS
jgi:phage shock protein A